MRHTLLTIAAVGFTTALMSWTLTLPQRATAGQTAEDVERGREIYRQHCAACHGTDAKGNGPTAAALKKAPPDLTAIQKKGEPFPFDEVMSVIDGEKSTVAHGTREMPVWGTIFRRVKGEMLAQLDIYMLTKYIESIQKHGR